MKTTDPKVQCLSAPSVKSFSVHHRVWGSVLTLLGIWLGITIDHAILSPSFALRTLGCLAVFSSLGNLFRLPYTSFSYLPYQSPQRATKVPISFVFPNPKTRLCAHSVVLASESRPLPSPLLPRAMPDPDRPSNLCGKQEQAGPET